MRYDRWLVRTMYTILVATVVLTTPLDARAWGKKGHRIVGHVARELLVGSATIAAIKQIMGSDDLANFALYLDEQKVRLEKNIPGSREWHFDDVPICGTKPYSEYCTHGNCASTQIPRYQAVLSDSHNSPATDKNKQRFAIFVLTHLVGDVHQPLHAADNDDRGGNEISVRLPDGRKMNLDAAWDTAFVEVRFGGQNEVTVAKGLIQKYSVQGATWQKGKAKDWIAESYGIAKSIAYGKLPNFSCEADLGGARIALADDYVRSAQETVEEQLAKGRLPSRLRPEACLGRLTARRENSRCPGVCWLSFSSGG
jgi:hypothetical protein